MWVGRIGLLLIVMGIATKGPAMMIRAKSSLAYESQALILIAEDVPEVDPFSAAIVYNPNFLNAQIELIQSNPMLEEVANRLDLRSKRGSNDEKMTIDRVVHELGSRISVVPARDTLLVSIRARSDDPEEAALLANTLAEVYRDFRLETSESELRRSISTMKEELDQQGRRIKRSEERLNQTKMEYNFSDNSTSNEVDKLAMEKLRSEANTAKQIMVENEKILDMLDSQAGELTGNTLILTNHQPVIKVIRKIADIDAELGSMTGLGPNHPERLELEKQKARQQSVLKDAISAIRSLAQLEHAVAKEKFNALTAHLDRMREQEPILLNDYGRPYRRALAELEREKMIFAQLKSRLQQEIITRSVQNSGVEIIERAIPNAVPVKSSHRPSDEDLQTRGNVEVQLRKSLQAAKRLESAMESGDQDAIDTALDDLSQTLQTALDAVGNGGTNPID